MAGRTAFLLLSVVLLSGLLRASALLDPVDFLALQAVRKALEDMPGSAFFPGWDFTADPCAFPGVLCAGDRVVSLALGDPRAGSPGLIGRLDPALGRLSSLAELTLVPGRVTGPIPAALAGLPSLRFLALSRNLLTGPVPSALLALPSLSTLDLGSNRLSGPLPAGTMPALANLILSRNLLSGAIPPLPRAALLERLDLRRNNLSGAVPTLPASLRYLSLASNRLHGPISFLAALPRINYIDLSANRFSGAIPPAAFSLPAVSLLLQRNQLAGSVTPAAPVAIGTVDLSFNRLGGAISPLLASVQSLYLNNNRFTGWVPRSLVQRLLDSGIQTLYLQHNFLTGIEIDAAAELPMSAQLCLQYNCMVPPLQAPCPRTAGSQKTRPLRQCPVWTRG